MTALLKHAGGFPGRLVFDGTVVCELAEPLDPTLGWRDRDRIVTTLRRRTNRPPPGFDVFADILRFTPGLAAPTYELADLREAGLTPTQIELLTLDVSG